MARSRKAAHILRIEDLGEGTSEITSEEFRAIMQGRGKGRNQDGEHREQVALFHWVLLARTQIPELYLFHAIPNGGKRPQKIDANGRKFSPEAIRLKQEGTEPGIPDLHLPIARQGFHSLYIEMKYKDNKPSEAQMRIIGLLRDAGNRVEVCYSWEEGKAAIENYLFEEWPPKSQSRY